MSAPPFTVDEMMTIAAARRLRNGQVCFVGIGLPSAAANLARLTHAPELILIYESGTIAARPDVLPLSIGDGELAETADTVVSVPEMFRYWLQGGRIEIGFLGAAQVDRHGNLNTTVIGDYRFPATRLPGAGGAPEIATSAQEAMIVMKQSPRSFVEQLGFRTTAGHAFDRADLARRPGRGPTAIITDIGILEPGDDGEFVLTVLHPDRSEQEARAATGWPLRISERLRRSDPPTRAELEALRALHARTAARGAATWTAPR